MNKEKLLNRVTNRLKKLNTYKISLTNDFLDFLEKDSNDKATDELLSIPGFYENYLKAIEEVKKGKIVDFNSIKVEV
jgi:hypothetical protein